MTDKRQQLQAEWHQVHGTDIPRHMVDLPDETIEEALSHSRHRLQPVREASGNDDSLLDSDNHNNLT